MKKVKGKAAKVKSAAKEKAAVPVAAPEKKTAVALDIKRERCDIETSRLLPAPWNPRGEITPESVADLVASMATVGVIEPVVAMAGPDGASGNYILIAGHRRVAAAKLAGLATVPCEVLSGIDVATAKRMTFIENLQRRDADPILESNLVAELVADGMTTDEIAAEIGRDRKWVLRRKNLAQLSPSWRKRVASGEKITTDCLEHIAAYPEAIQERLKKSSAYDLADGTLHWSDIRHDFEYESRELKDACFDCSKCYNCAKNSGCTPDLFDWVGGKNPQLGRCLDAACFKRRTAKHVADTLEAAKASGVTIVKNNPTYSGKKTSPTKTSKCNTLYTWEDYDKVTHIIWSERPRAIVQNAGSAGKAKLSAKEIAERKETRERNKAIRHLAQVCATDGNLARWLAAYLSGPDGVIHKFAPFVVHHLFRGIDSWMLAGSRTDIHDCAKALCFNSDAFEVPPEWTQAIVADVVQKLEPGRNEWAAHENARIICAMFADDLAALPDGLTPEEIASIYPATEHEGFERPAIKWDTAKQTADDPDLDDEANVNARSEDADWLDSLAAVCAERAADIMPTATDATISFIDNPQPAEAAADLAKGSAHE